MTSFLGKIEIERERDHNFSMFLKIIFDSKGFKSSHLYGFLVFCKMSYGFLSTLWESLNWTIPACAGKSIVWISSWGFCNLQPKTAFPFSKIFCCKSSVTMLFSLVALPSSLSSCDLFLAFSFWFLPFKKAFLLEISTSMLIRWQLCYTV